jgi:hypothetical protein
MFSHPNRDRTHLIFRKDGSVDRSGIVTPRGTRVHWRGKSTLGGLLNEPVDIVAIAIPGHKYFGGIGMQHYAEAEIEVYADLGDGWYREIIAFPVKSATKLGDARG